MSKCVPLVSNPIPYAHGSWQRIGDTMKLWTKKRMLPRGFRPAAPAQIQHMEDGWMLIFVRIQGWTNTSVVYPIPKNSNSAKG